MDLKVNAIIEKVMNRFEKETRENPLRDKNHPFYTDFIIKAIFEHPEWSTNDYVDLHQVVKGERIELNVPRFFFRNYIAYRDGKEEVIQIAAEATPHMFNLLVKDDIAANQGFMELIKMQRYYRRRWPLVARVLMTRLANHLGKQRSSQLQELAKRIQGLQAQMLVPMSTRFINTLIEQVGMARGLEKPKTVKDKIQSLLEDVNDVTQQEWGDGKDAEALRADNADLRAALHNLRYELEDLQSQLQNTQETSKSEGIVTFLTELNSATSGYLLDNMAISHKVIGNLIKQGWEPELPEIEGVVYSVKVIIKFLMRLGLEQMKEVGSVEKVALRDLTYINYLGSEFEYPDQVKWVKYQSPGWRYKGEIISWAKAIELDPESFKSELEENNG